MHIQIGQRVRFGVRLDARDHLIGIDLMTDRSEDSERIFTLLIGIPFVSFKLSVRTHPCGLRGAT